MRKTAHSARFNTERHRADLYEEATQQQKEGKLTVQRERELEKILIRRDEEIKQQADRIRDKNREIHTLNKEVEKLQERVGYLEGLIVKAAISD